MGVKDITDITLKNILSLVWENDVSENDFCSAININKSAVTDWKTGKTTSYKRHLSTISSYFEISVIDLISDQLIASRVVNDKSGSSSKVDADFIARVNEFYSFPLEVQDVALMLCREMLRVMQEGK